MDRAGLSTAPELPGPEPEPAPRAPGKGQPTYGAIVESLLLIGTSSAVNMALGVVRTKAMALLLGPAGYGLLSLFGSVADLARCVSGMGVNSSGVRQIAAATGSGDPHRVAETVLVLRRVVLLLGVCGALLLALLAPQVSRLTFGTEDHAGAVALLAVAVLFRLVADGQAALIQGLRRIGDLARLGILGSLLGTGIGIPLVYLLREDGVVPYLIVVAGSALLMSWWYSRKVRIPRATPTRTRMREEAGDLLKLGFSFMGTSLMFLGAGYAVRIILARQVGLDAAGFYQAAWALAGLYVGFVHDAMGADFYPRLVGVAEDNPQCVRLVNEQAQVSMLLAGPGVIATLTFAPLVLTLLYSADFHAADGVLRWICLGMALRVMTWPMGFIIVAKGRRVAFLATEAAWASVGVGLAWALVGRHGLEGAGIAFAGSYAFHFLLIYPVVRRLSGFRWSSTNRKAGALFIASVGSVFAGFEWLPEPWAVAWGALMLLASSIHSARTLTRLVPVDQLPPVARRLLGMFGRRGLARPKAG